MRRATATLVLLFCAFAPTQACAQPGRDCKTKLLEQLPIKWQEFRTLSKRLQGKKTSEMKEYDHTKLIAEGSGEYDVKQSSRAMMVVRNIRFQRNGKPDNRYDVEAANSAYRFRLRRKDDKTDWALFELEITANAKPVLGGRPPLAEVMALMVSPHFRLETGAAGPPLAELICEPGFLREALEVEHEGRMVVRVGFTRSQKVGDKLHVAHGWVLVDPELYWCVLEYEMQFPQGDGKKDSFRGRYEATIGDEHLPIIKRAWIEYNGLAPSGEQIGRWTKEYHYHLHEVADVPEDEFTLSAFGLPEPQGIVWQRPSRWYLWIIGAAVVCLAAGALLWRRVHRRGLANQASVP